MCAWFSENGLDCDDSNAEIYPNAPEICDEIDNDCNGWIDVQDGNLIPTNWYMDRDQDGTKCKWFHIQ